MTHPENSKRPQKLQLPDLGAIDFGGLRLDHLVIEPGQDLLRGLHLAADIGEGVEQLCERLGDSINDGEVAYLAEVRALGLLSSLASAITRAAWHALSKECSE
ncbi:hypothetical protein [Pseudomonas asplenii]|uniref:hypothetical protein n=1 Tax=Pseudomonas asplenii TaxID=53407 RepID=UPI0012BC78C8|nr:hypothetical protein [Pseudomonas fuscovaginae]